MHLHWDGDNDSVDERNLSAALGAGVTPVTVDHAAMKRVRDWIWTLPPPKYPYADRRGARVRGAQRSMPGSAPAATPTTASATVSCRRDRASAKSSRSRPSAPTRIGSNSYTEAFAANQYMLFPDSQYRFTHFRKTYGYANHPLDGIWARAPYLHNGSVPTLRDLLEPPDRRPAAFYRGYDVFDQQKVGFVSNVPSENGRTFTRYDTSLPGNGNARARLRHDADRRGQDSDRRVHEDVLGPRLQASGLRAGPGLRPQASKRC